MNYRFVLLLSETNNREKSKSFGNLVTINGTY